MGTCLEMSVSAEFYALELCGQVLKQLVDFDYSNNVEEFIAMREAALIALQQDVRIIDFYTDRFLLYQTTPAN